LRQSHVFRTTYKLVRDIAERCLGAVAKPPSYRREVLGMTREDLIGG
jgi:hypothetical protein